MQIDQINDFLGDLDLFLMDWILKGKVPFGSKILDAGSGVGRNLSYFLNGNFEVHAIDRNHKEIELLNFVAQKSFNRKPGKEADLLHIPFEDQQFDFIICSRVLHFADDEKAFRKMTSELFRVLKPSGCLYVSMASSLSERVPLEMASENKMLFPDGKARFLLTEELLDAFEVNWENQMVPRTVIHGQEHEETTLILRPRRKL